MVLPVIALLTDVDIPISQAGVFVVSAS